MEAAADGLELQIDTAAGTASPVGSLQEGIAGGLGRQGLPDTETEIGHTPPSQRTGNAAPELPVVLQSGRGGAAPAQGLPKPNLQRTVPNMTHHGPAGGKKMLVYLKRKQKGKHP